MISNVASFIWSSAPLMNAVLTVILLLMLRSWSRDVSNVIKPVKQIGKKIEKSTKDACKLAKDNIEGLDDAVDAIESTTCELDNQFFGELFVASFLAGLLVKYGWN